MIKLDNVTDDCKQLIYWMSGAVNCTVLCSSRCILPTGQTQWKIVEEIVVLSGRTSTVFFDRQTTSTSILYVDVLANYFWTKIDMIRQSTSGALRSIIEPRIIEPLTDFEVVTVNEIIKLLCTLPSKQCSLDTVPTWLVKSMVDNIAPLLCVISKTSLKSAVMSVCQK